MNLRLESIEQVFSRIQQLHTRFQIPFPPANFKDLFLEKQQQLKADDYKKVIEKYARENKIDPDLVRAVIKAESDFNWNAVSKKGALGLMQLMPDTAQSLGVDNPFDAEQNISGGVRYLRDMIERYDGDLKKALAAYNAGPEKVDKYKGIPPYVETRDYVNKVLREYDNLKK